MTLRTKLTLYYVVAILLLAVVLVSTHVILVNRISASDDSARLINIAGMQRMLSQRISFAASLALVDQDPRSDAVAVAAMELGILRMTANHAEISAKIESDTASPEVKALFLGEDGVASGVDRFLDTARRMLRELKSERSTALSNPEWASVADSIDTRLLGDLDTVVTQLQLDAEQDAAVFLQLVAFSLVLSLLILLVQWLLVFRPMMSSSVTEA